MPLYAPTYASGVPSGAAFPSSPATNDFFHRTDRGITYYYDGTRWLSTTPLVLAFPQGVIQSATHEVDLPHPYAGLYDIYVTHFHLSIYQQQATTSANYFNCRINSVLGAAVTNVSAIISSQNDAVSSWVRKTSATPNAVVPNTEALIQFSATEVGTQTGLFVASINYRLVG